MLQRIRKYFHKILHAKQSTNIKIKPTDILPSLRSSKGQVAVVLILIIAIGLIFYAVTLNLGRVSQAKILTTIAANKGAAKMVSLMASYGEQVFQEQMGGQTLVCQKIQKSKSWISTVIAVIIIIIVTWITWGAGAAAAAAGWSKFAVSVIYGASVVMAVSAVGMIVSLAMQLSMTAPGTMMFWDEMLSSMPISSQFLEQGIQTGVTSVVTDQVMIPDLLDFDRDGRYGDIQAAEDPNSAYDYISRFSFYYTERLREVVPPPGGDDLIEDFIDALEAFLYPTAPGDFGLYDPVHCGTGPGEFPPGTHYCCPNDPLDPVEAASFPAICDPCCMGSDAPLCCENGFCAEEGIVGGNPASCRQRSFYRVAGSEYSHIYDPIFENHINAGVLSLRERIGRDDEHHRYNVQAAIPDVVDNPAAPTMVSFQLLDDADQGFFVDDSTGVFQGPPPVGAGIDSRTGIFPFLHRMKFWGVGLTDPAFTPVNYAGVAQTDDLCHMCDDDPASPVGGACAGLSYRLLQLDLPTVPLPPFSGGFCVDNQNAGPGTQPLIPDNVPSATGLFAADAACAETTGGWKEGADLFCTTTNPPEYPYDSGCTKHGGVDACTITSTDPAGETTEFAVDCACNQAPGLPGTAWQDDNLDGFVYGITGFVVWAETLLDQDVSILADHFEAWYPEAADWIEPMCDPDNPEDWPADQLWPDSHCDGSFTQEPREGYLYTWWKNLDAFRPPIEDWLEDPGTRVLPVDPPPYQYVGDGCAEDGDADLDVWCIPPPQMGTNSIEGTPADIPVPLYYPHDECPGVNYDEQASFDSDGDTYRGNTVADVVGCLTWNIEDPLLDASAAIIQMDDPDNPGTPIAVSGNYLKFQNCATSCSQENCSRLPRSLISSTMPFETTGFTDPAIVDCLAYDGNFSTAVEECAADCDFATDGSLDPAVFPVLMDPLRFTPPNMVAIDGILSGAGGGIELFCRENPAGTLPGMCADIDNNPTGDIDCSSETAYYDQVEAAMCDNLGSCCDFPPPTFNGVLHFASNPFYTSLIEPVYGFCGPRWKDNEFNYFGFYLLVLRARGSCTAAGPEQSLIDSINNILVAVEAAHVPLFTDCLAAADEAGCQADCSNLPTRNLAGEFYGVEPYYMGIADPADAIDQGHKQLFNNCLNVCGADHCWGGNPEGEECACGTVGTAGIPNPLLPEVNNAGTNYGLVPAGYGNPQISTLHAASRPFWPTQRECSPGVWSPTIAEEKTFLIPKVLNCMDDCAGNSGECATLDVLGPVNHHCINFGFGVFTSPPFGGVAAATTLATNCKIGVDPETWVSVCGAGCDGYTSLGPDSVTLDCASDNYDYSDIELCAGTWENSCSGGVWGIGIDDSDNNDWDPVNWEPTYYDEVLAGELIANSCTDPAFMTFVQDSANAAKNQVAKFEKRRDLLEGRRQEAIDAINVFTAANDAFRDFLNGGDSFTENSQNSPSERLINARMNRIEEVHEATASVLVYVWQDETIPPAWNNAYWHAVKIEARIPGRCNNDCGSGGGDDPLWPRVATFQHFKYICSELRADPGMVKIRVIRYDQDRPARGLTLPNGTPLWDIRFTHPGVSGDDNPGGVDASCQPLMDQRLGVSAAIGGDLRSMDWESTAGADSEDWNWQNAFMLNKAPNRPGFTEDPPDVDPPFDGDGDGEEDQAHIDWRNDNYDRCWLKVHQDMLRYGVASESCAEYFFGGDGFRMKFVPCNDTFLIGGS